MNRIESDDDFKKFIEENREKILTKAVNIEDLPSDDEWIQDNIWDEIYEKEVVGSGAV